MFNFDDEIVIGFYDQVPWLLLLNLLVMFLLIFLLCCSTFFAFDITNEIVEEEGDSQLQKLQSRSNNSNSVFINDYRVFSQDDSKVCRYNGSSESRKMPTSDLSYHFCGGDRDSSVVTGDGIFNHFSNANQHQTTTRRYGSSSTSRGGSCREIEEIPGGTRLSAGDAVTQKALSSCSSLSPCHWLEIASKAFLSCLGLHNASEESPRSKKRKESSCDDHSNSSTWPKQHQF